MRVATPAMIRRVIPAQKEEPWEFVELVMAAAGKSVDDDVAETEAKLGEVMDVGTVAVPTVPDDIGGTELSRDDGESVPSDEGEVAYGV